MPNYKQKFRAEWMKHPELKDWLVEDNDNSNKAICTYCKCSLSCKMHDLISHSHTAKHMAKMEIRQKNCKLPFKSVPTGTFDQEATLAFYVAAHTSIASVDHLTKACRRIYKDASYIKLSRTKCTYIIRNVLAPHFAKELITDVGDRKFSLLIDESTDIGMTKILGMAIIYFSQNAKRIVSTYFSMIEIERGDAECIAEALKAEVKRFKLKMENLVGIGTDNANVMVGRTHSVYTLLKRDNPALAAIRCVCHSVQLAVSNACKNYLPTELEFLVNETYNWFSKSTIRQCSYKKLYNAINDGMDPLKITRTSDTRWLAIEVSVSRIIDQWLELKTHFGVASQVEKCHKASVLFDLYKNEKLLAILLFLRPILGEMQKLNKSFQSRNSDSTRLLKDLGMVFGILQEKIISPDDIVDIISTDYTPYIKRNCNLGYTFENHIKTLRTNFKINENEEVEIRLICTNFIIALVDQLKERLPDNYEILKNVDLFSVKNALNRNKDDITGILERFNVDSNEIENIVTQYNKINLIIWINVENTAAFWNEVRLYKDAGGNNVFVQLSNFALMILSLPWSNADVERIFSQMNLVKNKVRNRMKLPTLSSILSIRYGLNLANKCCMDYVLPKEVLLKVRTVQKYNEDNTEILDDNIDETISLLSHC